MKRRQLLIGLTSVAAASGLTAGTASASWWTDIKDAVVGHAKDLQTRLTHEDEILEASIIGSGKIDVDAHGQDIAHNASGTIGLVHNDDGYHIQLGSDFKSSPGPDYHVYISRGKDVNDEEDFKLFKHYELGPLKSGSGASYYHVSDDIMKATANDDFSVVIWCKQFGAYIGAALIELDR